MGKRLTQCPRSLAVVAALAVACGGGEGVTDTGPGDPPADDVHDGYVYDVPVESLPTDLPSDTTPDTASATDLDAGAEADAASSGNRSCAGFWVCVGNVCEGVPDAACTAACRADLSPFAQQQVDWALACFEDNDCLDAPSLDALKACIEAACLDEYMACFSDGPEYPCSGLVSCLDSCDGAACEAGCHDGQPPWTEATWAAWQACVSTSCPACVTDAPGDACHTCEATIAADACPDLRASCHPWGIAGCGTTRTCMAACTASGCLEGFS